MKRQETDAGKLERKTQIKLRFSPSLFLAAVSLILLSLLFLKVNRSDQVQSRTTEFGMRNIGQLVTQEGFFTNVQSIRDSREVLGISIPLTEKNYVYSYNGKVRAGVDFEKIKISVDSISQTVHVKCPSPEIFDITIDPDSFVVYHEGNNPFNSLKLDEINRAQIALQEEVRENAKANGILDNAAENAKTLIRSFLGGIEEYKDYTFDIVIEEDENK